MANVVNQILEQKNNNRTRYDPFTGTTKKLPPKEIRKASNPQKSLQYQAIDEAMAAKRELREAKEKITALEKELADLKAGKSS